MNATPETKAEIHADINRLREEMGQPLLAAYKAKDLSRDQLLELREMAELDLNTFNDEGRTLEAPDFEHEADDIELDVDSTEPKRNGRYNDKGERRCGCCGNFFPIEAFGSYKRSNDGLASYTKAHTKLYRAGKNA